MPENKGERVTFSSGRTENVYTVPAYLTRNVKVKLENDPRFAIDENDTPDDVVRKGRALALAIDKDTRGASFAWAFQDTEVPDDWQFPRVASNQGLTPREGDDGRLADFVEYELVVTPHDTAIASAVMFGATEEEVSAAGALFRPCRFAQRCLIRKVLGKH